MSFGDPQSIGQQPNITIAAMQEVAKDVQTEQKAEQIDSQKSLLEAQETATNPFAARIQTTQKNIKTHKGRVQKMMESGEKSKRLLPVEQIKDMAGQFQRRNPELRANVLVLLREYIKPGDTKEDILRKLQEFYPDPALADEALEFLLETTDGELRQQVVEAKADLLKQFSREIAAGRNISTQAQQAAQKGLGTPTTLRDLYRDITGNPRDSTTLFEELSKKYAFKELKKVVDFLLHSLGSDMKSKGPSIDRGQLHRLFTETRSLQAILGVYRFFRGRMGLVEGLFKKEGLDMPQQLSFELMAQQFMNLAAERYPSSGKVMERAVRLGVERWILAKIIVLSQFRDAIREVAINQIYKSLQHRDELFMAIIEALEDLEDELEELEEKEEREGDGDGENDSEEQEDEDK
jgi:type III secretion protein W